MVDFEGIIEGFSYLIRANYNLFFNNSQSLSTKIRYFLAEGYTIILNKRKITYFGKEFNYDNRFAPVLLSEYNCEIKKISKSININELKKVIDIGANVGQWAFTLKSLYPQISIYSFEPNTSIFSLLKENSKDFLDWKTFNLAVGSKNEKKSFYFSKEASAEGSLYQENMSRNLERKDIQKIDINVIKLDKNKLYELKIPKRVDLIKIDVEGFEEEVIKGLSGIETKYIYVEIPRKDGDNVEIEKMRLLISSSMKKNVKLLSYDVPSKKSSVLNALFEID